MPDEIELKFQVPVKALEAIGRLKWVAPCGPVKRQKLRSVYFDTPDGKLRNKGLVLRVRHVGARRLQTLKADGTAPFARQEWECAIRGDLPDLSRLKKTPIGRIAKSVLKPVFETVVTRTAIPLRSELGTVELALDRGEIKASGAREPVSEVEIELKDGDPAAIVTLAERLTRAVPAHYAVRAKSERGYALCDGTPDGESRARPVALGRKISVAEAFRSVGLECLRQIVANESAVRASRSEGVHQMRVGLRRLRAAMSLFKPLLQDRESRAVKAGLKWLTAQLGPARDLDVFIHDSVEPVAKSVSGAKILRRDMMGKRKACFRRARAAVEGERYRKLVLKTLFWLMQGAWCRRGDASLRARPAAAFAAEVLETRTQRIVKRAKKLAHLEPIKRHRLRIAVKKLRYATEFFSALFGGARKRKAALGEVLEKLQDALGRLNDITVHRKLAGDMVGRARPQKAFAMGVVTGREQAQIKACLSAARKAGAALKSQKPFW